METKNDKSNARDRKFETLFEGDEIEGKFYPLEGGVTGLDAPTGDYLVATGRLAEVDDERFAQLKKAYGGEEKAPAETDEEREAREAREAEEKAARARTAAAQVEFEAGRIPDDLIDPAKAPDAKDRLVSRDKLDELAKAAGADVEGSMNKGEVAVAIMAARAKADASNG